MSISGIGAFDANNKNATDEVSNDSVWKSTVFASIDTTASTLTATEQISLTASATAGAVTFYADAAAIAVPADAPDYEYMSGTSMATPMLAGCYAELASLYPNESPLQLRGRICGGTNQLVATKDSSGNKSKPPPMGILRLPKRSMPIRSTPIPGLSRPMPRRVPSPCMDTI